MLSWPWICVVGLIFHAVKMERMSGKHFVLCQRIRNPLQAHSPYTACCDWQMKIFIKTRKYKHFNVVFVKANSLLEKLERKKINWINDTISRAGVAFGLHRRISLFFYESTFIPCINWSFGSWFGVRTGYAKIRMQCKPRSRFLMNRVWMSTSAPRNIFHNAQPMSLITWNEVIKDNNKIH